MRLRRIDALLLILGWALAASWPVAAQPPAEAFGAAEIVEEDLGEDMEALLAEAEEVFVAGDQPESIPMFERIILLLERRRGEGTLDEQGADWLTLSLFRRAEARHNLLDVEGATADLRSIVRFDPAWDVPAGYMFSRKLAELLAGVRDAETGVVDALIDPPDAELYLEGEPLGPVSGPRRVLAGERRLEVRRPGYTSIEQPLTIPPGESVPLDLKLERSSAVVRLTTRPAGVEVVLRGRVLAVSEPPPGDTAEGPSADLLVEGLEVGEQLLTLRKPGYRPVEVRLEVTDLIDYSLDPVALEPTRGTVAISNLPAAARVLVDGEPWTAAGSSLDLPPGPHVLRVEAGRGGLFEHRFDLEDRQVVEIEVDLRPSLVLLGVLGGDRVAATDLEMRLAQRLGELSRWAVAQRADRGFELLGELGIDRDLLRGLADEAGAEPPDWAAVQETFDRGLAGSAYLLAVLSDDLYASRADLWLWSAAPGPRRPARRRISLAGSEGVDGLAAVLDRPLRLTAPWVGARFIDSPAAETPLVLSVDPQGPAAAAGLRAGDTIRAIDGEAVAGARRLVERISGLEPGGELVLQVGGEGGDRAVTLTPGASPVVASLNDPSALDPALAARLASLEVNAGARAPSWLVRLNLGVVLMRSGEWRGAAEALRGIEAPAAGGVGKATIDYLLGVVLLEVDPATYRDTARGLIGRAADGAARLEHNDGPSLAPRAAARLETLLDRE